MHRAVRAGLLLGSLLGTPGAHASPADPWPALDWTPSTTSLHLGEPVDVQARWPRPGTPPTLPVHALWPQADLDQQSLALEDGERWLRLRLYPLQAGVQTLRLPGARSAVTLDVQMATPRQGPTLLSRGIDGGPPARGQPQTLWLQACAAGALQWEPPRLAPSADYAAVPLDDDGRSVTADGCRRWRWSLTPTRTGPLQLELPRLTATRFGTLQRYAFAPLDLFVQNLPAYLPAGLPLQPPALRWTSAAPGTRRLIVEAVYAAPLLRGLLQSQLDGSGWTLGDLRPLADRPGWEAVLESGRAAWLTHLLTPQPPALQLPWFDATDGRPRAQTVPAP